MTRPSRRAVRLRQAPLALLALGAVALLAACGAAGAANRTGSETATEARTVHLTVAGRDRSYLLEPATGGTRNGKAALIVVLHQEGGTPEGVAAETDLTDLRAQGATLAYPSGVDHSWDAGLCCGLPSKEKVDDVAFLSAVFADVATHTPVDPARRALVGYSSGGMLTYNYVCKRPGTLAVAVVVSGSLESPCAPQITVPDVLAVHGQADGTIGLEKPKFVRTLGLSPQPVSSTLRTIAKSADCAAPTMTKAPGVDTYVWTGCRGGKVEARVVAGAGHGWGTLDATQRTTQFLRERLLDR